MTAVDYQALRRIEAAIRAEASSRLIALEEVPSNDGCGVLLRVVLDTADLPALAPQCVRQFYFANHELPYVNEAGYLVRLCRPSRYGLRQEDLLVEHSDAIVDA